MWTNYLKIAWRNLRQQKLYSLINIGSLSVAISAALLILMWVQNELRFDQDVPDAERIFLVKNQEETSSGQSTIWEHSPYPLAALVAQEFPEVELVTQMTRSRKNEISLTINGQIFPEDYVTYVDENWFKLFHYDFWQGNADAFRQHPFSLILTESKAEKLFGEADVVGRSVQIDSVQYEVRAVIRDNPVNSSFQFDVLLPIAAKLNTPKRLEEANNWLYSTHRTFLRLRPGTNPDNTATKINRLYVTNRQKDNLTAMMLPLAELHFEHDFKISAFPHGDRSTVGTFTLLAVLLLVAACVNYVNLAIARTNVRSKEIGMRKIVGASRSQLFFQIVAECVLISLVALGFAMLICLLYTSPSPRD